MTGGRAQAHEDVLDIALVHYNDSFRFRYRLPATDAGAVSRAIGSDAFGDACGAARAGGVVDAGCAVIARHVVASVPRYAVGTLDSRGRLVDASEGEVEAYLGRHVLLVNPLGGEDNWEALARWFRQTAGEVARRRELAGLASKHRPHQGDRQRVLAEATLLGRAVVMPPDEGFSSERAAEVAYIFDVEVETLRTWKRRTRRDRGCGRSGRPGRNR